MMIEVDKTRQDKTRQRHADEDGGTNKSDDAYAPCPFLWVRGAQHPICCSV